MIVTVRKLKHVGRSPLKMVLSKVTVLLIITLGAVSGQQVESPKNTEVHVGDTVTLRCAYHPKSCLQVRWQKRSEFGPAANISDDNTVYDGKYRLDNSTFCDLVIDDVQLMDSGTFICTTAGSNSGSADLIVLPDVDVDVKPEIAMYQASKSKNEKNKNEKNKNEKNKNEKKKNVTVDVTLSGEGASVSTPVIVGVVVGVVVLVIIGVLVYIFYLKDHC